MILLGPGVQNHTRPLFDWRLHVASVGLRLSCSILGLGLLPGLVTDWRRRPSALRTRPGAVRRAGQELHGGRRAAPRRRLAAHRSADTLEPAARHGPLDHRGGRRAPLHDVPRRQRQDRSRSVEHRRDRRLARRRVGQDALGAQVSVEDRGLQPRRRPPLDAARRRRPAVHVRHQQAALRVRQAQRQGAVVARPREGVQRAGAAHPPGDQGRLRLQRRLPIATRSSATSAVPARR